MYTIAIFFGVLTGTVILSEMMRVWKARLSPQRLGLMQRGELSAEEKELARPFALRVIRPLVETLTHWISRFAPLSMQTSLREELVRAGWRVRFRPVDFLLLRWFLMIALPLASWFLLNWINVPSPVKLIQVLFFFFLGWRGPILLLRRSIMQRSLAIEKALPYTIDLLVVSAEAGLGFDAATQRVVQRVKGPLSAELNRVLQDMKLGKSRQEAWLGLKERTHVPELNTFVNAVIQASQLGLSLSNVLRVQADLVRQKRRERAETKARKMPIKILVPLIFFILPALFIIILGPVAMIIVETFKQV